MVTVKFKHSCPDWDYMEIDEWEAEFMSCTCDLGPEAKKDKDLWNEHFEEYNRKQEEMNGRKLN